MPPEPQHLGRLPDMNLVPEEDGIEGETLDKEKKGFENETGYKTKPNEWN